ncbi:hypothetical protein RRG08_039976 [Elysia crispata]|uniref:Uncharacterized protein n=1 Tax=Elysia crispata TaxID=231223 RepID=A0AAE0Z829_9GAST|nr:hypothetical protein RRG08_039976 [Elysia crispata]
MSPDQPSSLAKPYAPPAPSISVSDVLLTHLFCPENRKYIASLELVPSPWIRWAAQDDGHGSTVRLGSGHSIRRGCLGAECRTSCTTAHLDGLVFSMASSLSPNGLLMIS